MARLTAFVVDDHPGIRTMIARLLAEGGYDVIGQADDATVALEIVADLQPDVVTLDVSMPGMSGLVALPSLRAALPSAIIVMLTMDKQYREEARRSGTSLSILKHDAARELIPAIRVAREGANCTRGITEDS
jgi:DNA-binding NarL/FixJ family response regulator